MNSLVLISDEFRNVKKNPSCVYFESSSSIDDTIVLLKF